MRKIGSIELHDGTEASLTDEQLDRVTPLAIFLEVNVRCNYV